MVKERFGHGNIRVALRAHGRRTHVEVRLYQLLLPLRRDRETRAVHIRRRLLEVVLVQGLVVGRRVLRRVLRAAIVTYLKVIGLEVLHEVGWRLHGLRGRRMHKLLLLGCRLLELIVRATYTKIRCKGFVLILDGSFSFSFALLIKEGLLGRAKESTL